MFQSNRGTGGIFVLDPTAEGPPTRIDGAEGIAVQAYQVGDALLLAEFVRPTLPDGTRGDAVHRVTRRVDGTVSVLSAEPLTESIGSATPAYHLACAAGRCLVSTPMPEGVVFRWLDLDGAGLSDPVATLAIGARSMAWALSPDARRVVVLVADPAERITFDLQTGEREVGASDLDLPLSVSWMSDGAVYASGLSMQSVDVYRMGRLHDDGHLEVLHASMNTNFHTLVPAPDSSTLVLGSHSFGSDLWLLGP